MWKAVKIAPETGKTALYPEKKDIHNETEQVDTEKWKSKSKRKKIQNRKRDIKFNKKKQRREYIVQHTTKSKCRFSQMAGSQATREV